MKKGKWLFSILSIAVVVVAGWFLGHIVSGNNIEPVSVRAQGGGGIDVVTLQDRLNLVFVPASPEDTSQVKIPQEKAIASAQAEQEGRLKNATSISAELGRLTDPGLKELAAAGEKADTRLIGKQLVWVISFQGVDTVSQGPINSEAVSHEYNIVIDATTGEFIIGFTYR